jgi:hypothetical protein
MTTDSLSSRILAKDTRRREKVRVPEWDDCALFVTDMKAVDSDAFEREEAQLRAERGPDEKGNTPNMRARFLVRVLYDEQGGRVFTDDQADALGEQSAAVLDRLFDVAARLSSTTPEALETTAGKSPGTPGSATSSG